LDKGILDFLKIKTDSMRILLLSLFMVFCCKAISQNVGIGTENPTEKLDVSGNINLGGNLRVNNTSGQPGQVLMTGSTGNTQWVDMGQFKSFFNPGYLSGSWTVPAGVTKIMVEIWGGGGGGSKGAGGGGGGYLMAILNVTPGESIPYTIGGGGTGGNEAGTTGGNSSVNYGISGLYAMGGEGAQTNGIENNYGKGGTFDISNSHIFNRSYFGINGEGGQVNRLEYMQRSATEFLLVSSGGDGGDSPRVPNTGGKGRPFIKNLTTSTTILNSVSTQGMQPGGGGGAGFDDGGSFGTGASGAFGMILIHY
jgi:hypothetical protein